MLANDVNAKQKEKNDSPIKEWARVFEMLIEMDKKVDPQSYQKNNVGYGNTKNKD